MWCVRTGFSEIKFLDDKIYSGKAGIVGSGLPTPALIWLTQKWEESYTMSDVLGAPWFTDYYTSMLAAHFQIRTNLISV